MLGTLEIYDSNCKFSNHLVVTKNGATTVHCTTMATRLSANTTMQKDTETMCIYQHS